MNVNFPDPGMPVTAFLLTWLWLVRLPFTVRGQNTSGFDWTSVSRLDSSMSVCEKSCGHQIQPSNTLDWTPCYSSFQCTRLNVSELYLMSYGLDKCIPIQVPFDYSTPESPQAAIALIRYPSKVSSTAPSYAGPIFINPGGPGSTMK